MKRIFTSLVWLALIPWATALADPVEYTQPYKDGLAGTVTVTDEGVLYYDYGGATADAKASTTGYILFKSEDGETPLTITFEMIDLDTEKANLYIYDGDCGYSGWKGAIPENYEAKLFGTEGGYTFTSQSGSLSVLYYCPVFTSPGAGWKASVTAGTPKDMEFKEASIGNDGVQVWRGARDVALASFTLKMDGSLNPLTLDALKLDLSAIAQSGLVENIRLYDGASVSADALLGTLADGATTLEVASRELKTKNVFTVVADVKPDATGSIPVASVAELKVAGVDRAVDAATLQPVAVANQIRMANGGAAMTYVIDAATDFFDAGGPDGIVPAGANGTVTFVPATEGQKVKIDFSSLALFNTSSTGLNDVFRFYNGREAVAENLVAELLNEPRIVKSTAADGSLTVTFEVKQGNAGKNGWEAVVSQFVPSQMTLKEVTVENTESAIVAAGDVNVPLLLFNVNTDEQLDPLTLSGLSLAAADGADPSAISGIRIYALGETATFSTSTLYAETAAASGNVSLTGNYELSEGNNWFAVAIDIAENALSETPAGLKLVSVTVGGNAVVPGGDTQAWVAVDNVCRIAEGTHSHTMYGDWSFLSPAPAGSYSSQYPASTSDHIVTFIPTLAGATAQIEFDSFDVYYASSSYGTKATFEVYSGETVSAENLIWKLSSNDQQKTGPGRKLRSTAANGAITVKFNPNTTSSYNTGTGWNATVSQFIDHDAEVKSVEVAQASTAILRPGEKDAGLLDLDIFVEGTLSPAELAAVNLELTGKEVIKAVSVFTSAKGDFSDAMLWGTAAVNAEGTSVAVTRSGDVEATPLAEEHNYLRVSVDINDEVASDVAVDAKVVSLSLAGGKTVAVENGDPEGVRLTKNLYILESGEGNIVTVKAPIMFYDDGGPDANVTAGFSGTVTFVPANEGETLQINAEEFSIGSGRMYVYSGREVNEANIIGKATGYYTTNGPENLVSKADDGSLTVSFKANATATTLKGWAISVTPIQQVAMHAVAVAVSNGAETDVVRGSIDVPVAHVAVTTEGNVGKLALGSISVDFSGSTNVADITGARIYYTAANETFSPVAPVSEKLTVPADGLVSFAFTSPVELTDEGTFHLWIAADLSSTATPENVASAKLTGLVANDAPATLPEQAVGERVMVSGMGGTYRVGPSEDAKYHSLAAAVDALQLGVEDAVLFMLEDGEYKENITIADVQGTSAEHPVVFSSLSGNRNNVVISGASSLNKQGMIYVENSSYIHFRNLTIAPNSTDYFAGIHFKNGSRHCSVENCVVRAAEVSGVTTGISLVRTESGPDENQNCDYFTIKDCYVEGGYYGLYLAGTGYVTYPRETGLRVTGNTVTKTYEKAMFISDCSDFVVENNSVTMTESAKKGVYVVDLYRPKGAYRVVGNRIACMQALDFTGLYTRSGGGSKDAANPAIIANNAIYAPNAATGYTYGAMLDCTATNVVFAHNSVMIKHSGSVKTIYAVAFNGNAPAEGGLQVRNNIMQCNTTGGPLRPWNDTHYTNVAFSGNVYFNTVESDVIDTDGKTFAEYQEATGDNTSVWAQASFFSDTDLHLREAGDNFMMPRLDAVTTDADGALRSNPTTAGAYEFAPVVVESPDIMEGYPSVGSVSDVSAVVNTRWTVGGSLYAKAVKADASAPTREELLATRPVAIDADTDVPYTFNFLDQLTTYKAYFLVVSALEEESVIVESPEFTTKETIEELVLEIDWDEEPVQSGETILLQAYVTGGKEPYSYEWFNQMGELISGDDLLMEEAKMNQTYRLRVTSTDGQAVTAKAHVPVVTGNLVAATFEDLPLEAESNWMYDPENDPDTYSDAFFSGSFRFGNFPMFYENYGWVWCGYGYANETSTEFINYDNQCRNVVGGGAANTANYGVAYMYGADMTIRISATDAGVTVPGVYVTNAAVTLNSIVNGDGYSPAFTTEAGDYMTLVITGYDADGANTGRVEVSLADFRMEVPQVLTEWQWVDLSPLGSVSSLKVNYESSRQSTVPAYACIDQLGAANPMSGVDGVDSGIRLSVVADDCLSVLGIEGDYTLRLYTVDGVLRAASRQHGATTVSTDGLPTGACFAEIVTDSGERTVLRFLKK